MSLWRLGPILLAALAILSAPSARAQGQASVVLAEVTNEARGEVDSIAAAFGWKEKVPVIEGRENDTSSARVSLNSEHMWELLRRVPANDVRMAARLLVAHEVWHHVELKRAEIYAPPPSTAERLRVFECRADLMAAHYVTSTQAAPGAGPRPALDLETSDASRITQALWLPSYESAATDYPRPHQRAAAAHYGALQAMRERNLLAPEQRETVEKMLHVREGESLDSWSERSCQEITHFGGEAMLAIGANEPTFRRERGGILATVAYVNASRRPVEISMVMIAQGAQRRGDVRVATARRWYFPMQFTIAPFGRREVTALVPGVQNEDSLWVNASPTDQMARIMARFAGASVADPIPRLGTGLTSEELSFALAVQRLANDARSFFQSHRAGGAGRSRNGLFYDSLVDIPVVGGADQKIGGTQIQVSNEGAAFINKTLLSDGTRGEATKLYRATRAAVARVWPDNPIRDVKEGGASEFSVYITRYARMRITLGTRNGRYSVFFSMAPNLNGLTDF